MRLVLTPLNDSYHLLDAAVDNIRGDDGNDRITLSVTSLAKRMVVNEEAGNGTIVVTKAAVEDNTELELLSLYGDNYTGFQGSDTIIFHAGPTERVDFEVNGRGGFDRYDLRGRDYDHAIDFKNFNTQKDQLRMQGHIEVEDYLAAQLSKKGDVVTYRMYELELLSSKGQWAHLHRDSRAVREQERIEDGDSSVLFDITFNRNNFDGLVDALETRLNKDVYGNGVLGNWINPVDWI